MYIHTVRHQCSQTETNKMDTKPNGNLCCYLSMSTQFCTGLFSPTAYIVRWEVMFSQVSVCSGGGGVSRRDPDEGGGGTLARSRWGWVYPGQGWGTPPPPGMGNPPPHQGWVIPPPPRIGLQMMEYLIRCGRYASCVHAGGLSCCLFHYRYGCLAVWTHHKS